MKQLSILAFALLFSIATKAQTVWKLDPSHSKVNFSIEHLVISEVDGNFKNFEGSISTTKENFANATVNIKIDATSINTDNEQRDGHLKSEDFFHTSKFPNITFDSSTFKKKGKKKYVIKGNLTLRGVTKQETFVLTFGGTTVDGYGNTRAGFVAKTTISRLDYGVAWNAKTKQGTWTLGEEVAIVAKLEFIKK